MAKIRGYLIVHTGSEDIGIKIVSEESYHLLTGEGEFTESIMDELRLWHKDDPEELERVLYVLNDTKSNDDNEVAFDLPPIKINEQFASFESILDLTNFVKRHKDVFWIVDEWNGVIY